ncbi:MAG: DUF504 domain-containing protein [Methanosarcinales archaeon]|nr:DUF504 domain-containing protein [Methanosarcinales archaeon]
MDEEFQPSGRHPRHILNEIKWRGLGLDRTEVEILHRGAPHDRIRVLGSDMELGRSFFRLGETEIPYHRIMRIKYENKTVFQRLETVKGV